MPQEGEGSSGENGMNAGVSMDEKAEDRKMFQSYSGETLSEVSRGGNYAVIAVCVLLSMIFMKTGLLSFFFLMPLGYAVLATGSVWITFFAAAAANMVLSLVLHFHAAPDNGLWTNIFYFTVILFMFNWIMGGRNLRTAYRLIAASAAGAFAFIFLIMNNSGDTGFNKVLAETSELLASMFASSSGNNAAIQQAFTPERVLELIKSISIRGGAVISMLFVFFLNRQLTLTAMWLVKKQKSEFGLVKFFTPPYAIWVLSGALAAVLLSASLKIQTIEILSWNVLTVSVILFLAQGAGIVMHFFTRFTPVIRILASVVIMFMMLSPLCTIVIAAVLILGIAEIWLPIRVKKVES